MRNMSIGPMAPYGEGDRLSIDRFPDGRNISILALETTELEELARLILVRLGADTDEAEDAIDRARDLREEAETSQEQLPL